jgi:hypothetical protein
MDKVQKPSNSECNTSSSEPFISTEYPSAFGTTIATYDEIKEKAFLAKFFIKEPGIHSPTRLHGIVLKNLNTGSTLPLFTAVLMNSL